MTRWLMALGERDETKSPMYADDPSPDVARAVALVERFEDLFLVMSKWSELYGPEFTTWAMQTDAEDLDALPPTVLVLWAEEGPDIRLDYVLGGYVQVSDYRECLDYRDGRDLSKIPDSARLLIRS